MYYLGDYCWLCPKLYGSHHTCDLDGRDWVVTIDRRIADCGSKEELNKRNAVCSLRSDLTLIGGLDNWKNWLGSLESEIYKARAER